MKVFLGTFLFLISFQVNAELRSCDEAPVCSQISGYVYCGFNCVQLSGYVYCGQSPGHTCSQISGYVYCGANCSQISGYVYCGDIGLAQPANPATPTK